MTAFVAWFDSSNRVWLDVIGLTPGVSLVEAAVLGRKDTREGPRELLAGSPLAPSNSRRRWHYAVWACSRSFPTDVLSQKLSGSKNQNVFHRLVRRRGIAIALIESIPITTDSSI
jgi:hypothetical protein